MYLAVDGEAKSSWQGVLQGPAKQQKQACTTICESALSSKLPESQPCKLFVHN